MKNEEPKKLSAYLRTKNGQAVLEKLNKLLAEFGERDPEEEAEIKRRVFSRVGMGFYKKEDQPFVEHMHDLWIALESNNDPLRDYEHAKNAFKHEMFNHEYPINWQGDWDVIQCFCPVKYKGDGSEIDQTNWSDEIKRAYRDAAAEVMNKFNY